MSRAALLLWLVPSLALAQTTTNQVTVTETSDDLDDEIINIDECNGAVASRFSFAWSIVSTDASANSVELRVSDTTSCPLTSSNSSAKTTTLQSAQPLSGTSSTQTAQNLASLVGFPCDSGQQRTMHICAVARTIGSTEILQTGQLRVDALRPGAPVIRSVGVGDGALDITWDSVSGADRYRVEARVGGTPVRSDETDATDLRLGGLLNGVPHDVVVFAVSVAGNESVASAALQGTPAEVADFWRLYRSSGGRDDGGCGIGGGGLALLGLAPLALRRRRK